MKKFLFGIFSIILGFVGFSFAEDYLFDSFTVRYYLGLPPTPCQDDFTLTLNGINNTSKNFMLNYVDTRGDINSVFFSDGTIVSSGGVDSYILTYSDVSNLDSYCSIVGIRSYTFNSFSDGIFSSSFSMGSGSLTPSSSDIDVYYNNGNSVENITCDGTQAIQINGLSTITSTNTFTPYFNISYTDEDNQSLTESYSKNILYLENGQFKKTYTGNNERILTYTIESPNSSFSGYLPTFEITGGIEEVSESGNIFNNFAENSVKFTLSNIPSYIQYVILLFILFFILGFIRKFRRK